MVEDQREPDKSSATAIVGFVVGIFALLLSWVPIVNNGAFVVALVGLVFSIVGVSGTVRGKKRGKGLAIAALIINIIAIVVVLATQGIYGAAIDSL